MPLKSEYKIAGRVIGPDHPPFIIAEMSGNHNQSFDRALEIVDAVAGAGAHALKLQTYTADTMTLDLKRGEFLIDDSRSLWNGKSLYELYEEAHTPWEWHEPIYKRCRELGLICFSTPFDETAVDFLEELDTPCYKISSFENADIPLIRKAANTGKPLIISTGMATVAELDETVRVARADGCKDLILLKCTSTYPATPKNLNLLTIPHMREYFKCEVGLSDHTMGITAAVSSIALGATVIEKHFTLSRSDGGVDSAFSMEPDELAALVAESENAWKALGIVNYGPTEDENYYFVFRRSLYIAKDISAGEILTSRNLRCVRPGFGMAPKYLNAVLGRTVARKAKSGTPLSWDLIGQAEKQKNRS